MRHKKLNKTVLITGATSGIGREIALRFAKEEWDILCHHFSSKLEGNQLMQEIKKYDVNCRIFQIDLSSQNQLMRFVNEIKKIDIASVINNAGTYTVKKYFTKLTISDIKKTFMVNTFAPILITAAVFSYMKKRHFGRIVNISSIAAKYGGSAYSLHYGSSKCALEGVAKTLAKEGARYNILVNTIRPGVIDTEFHKKFPKDMKKRIAIIPLKKIGRPEDIAEIAYYLGSEKNNFITNEIIAISGGE